MTKRGTFRSPLRNEWDRVAAQFAASAMKSGREGTIARLMLDLMPPFIDAMERERDKHTPETELFDAIACAVGQMIEEAIEKERKTMAPRAALDHMLSIIYRVVHPRVVAPPGKLILPGGMP